MALVEQCTFDSSYGYPAPSKHSRQRSATDLHMSPPFPSDYSPPAPRLHHGAPHSAVSCGEIPLEREGETGASPHASPHAPPHASHTSSPARSPLRQREAKHRIAQRRRGSESDLLFPHSLSNPPPAPLPSRAVPQSRSGEFYIQPRLPRAPSSHGLSSAGSNAPCGYHAPRLSLDENAFVSAALTPGRRVSSGAGSADISLSPTALAASPAEQTSPYGAAMDLVASAQQLMEECRARGIQWELDDWEGADARKGKARMPQSASAGNGEAGRAEAGGLTLKGIRGRKAGRQRPARGQIVGGCSGPGGKSHQRMASVDELLSEARHAGLSKRAAAGGGGGERAKGGLSTKLNGGVGGIDMRFFQEFDDLPRALLHDMLAANAHDLGVVGRRNGQEDVVADGRTGARSRARTGERSAPAPLRRGAQGNGACGEARGIWEALEADLDGDTYLPRGPAAAGEGLLPRMRNDKAEDRDLYDQQFEEDGGNEAQGENAEEMLREQVKLLQQKIEGMEAMLGSRKGIDAQSGHSALAPPPQALGSRTPPPNVPLPRKRRVSAQFPSCASVPSFHSSSPSSSAKDREPRLPPAVPRANSKQSPHRSGSVIHERSASPSPSAHSHDSGHALTLGHTQAHAAAEMGASVGPKARGVQPELQAPRRARKHNSGSHLDVFAGFGSHSRSSSSGSVTAGGSGSSAQWEAVETALLACAEAVSGSGTQAGSDAGMGMSLHGAKWGNLSLGLGGLELQRALASAVPSLKATDFVLRMPYEDIKGRYSLGKKEIGEGRFGSIRTCLERATGHVYACKTISKKTIETNEDADDVRREVTFLAMLRGHPSVITLQEVFEDDKAIHLVMELCAGGDLFDRIKSCGQIPEADAALVLKQLLESLLHCRSLGIQHRDIKPENILLCSPSENGPIKLIDFGVATVLKDGEMCREMAGTPEYMAPEVLDECYNYEADVWSAGVSLYVMLSGVPPFWESSNRTLEEAIRKKKVVFKYWKWASVSEEAKELITRMLEKDPLDRITAREVLAHPWVQMHTNTSQ
ncbi:hypothetical protein CLOM_g17769 [Closterium sp. NIES-68]|nr:hypothetical protein CLOM_g17769 [Closterium sp. NIES-68]GJP61535.1 hypothetical protein CLOP_g18683 [Closterium sp. NIES-67]